MTSELSTEERLERLENALIAYIRLHTKDHDPPANIPPNRAYAQEINDFIAEILSERRSAPDF